MVPAQSTYRAAPRLVQWLLQLKAYCPIHDKSESSVCNCAYYTAVCGTEAYEIDAVTGNQNIRTAELR